MKMKFTAWSGVLALAAAANVAFAAGPTDPQIAAIVVTANQVDIDAGKLALSKAHSKDVKEFAQLMITDHSGVNKSATELVQKLHVTPEANPTSAELAEGRRRQRGRTEEAQRQRVRPRLCRSRSRLPPGSARCRRHDLDPQRAECRTQGAARQSASRVRRAPGAREESAKPIEQEGCLRRVGRRHGESRSPACCWPGPRPRPLNRRTRRLRPHDRDREPAVQSRRSWRSKPESGLPGSTRTSFPTRQPRAQKPSIRRPSRRTPFGPGWRRSRALIPMFAHFTLQ